MEVQYIANKFESVEQGEALFKQTRVLVTDAIAREKRRKATEELRKQGEARAKKLKKTIAEFRPGGFKAEKVGLKGPTGPVARTAEELEIENDIFFGAAQDKSEELGRQAEAATDEATKQEALAKKQSLDNVTSGDDASIKKSSGDEVVQETWDEAQTRASAVIGVKREIKESTVPQSVGEAQDKMRAKLDTAEALPEEQVEAIRQAAGFTDEAEFVAFLVRRVLGTDSPKAARMFAKFLKRASRGSSRSADYWLNVLEAVQARGGAKIKRSPKDIPKVKSYGEINQRVTDAVAEARGRKGSPTADDRADARRFAKMLHDDPAASERFIADATEADQKTPFSRMFAKLHEELQAEREAALEAAKEVVRRTDKATTDRLAKADADRALIVRRFATTKPEENEDKVITEMLNERSYFFFKDEGDAEPSGVYMIRSKEDGGLVVMDRKNRDTVLYTKETINGEDWWVVKGTGEQVRKWAKPERPINTKDPYYDSIIREVEHGEIFQAEKDGVIRTTDGRVELYRYEDGRWGVGLTDDTIGFEPTDFDTKGGAEAEASRLRGELRRADDAHRKQVAAKNANDACELNNGGNA